MQPTEQQVQRSLEALRTDSPCFVGGDDGAESRLDEVPTEVFRLLEQTPTIRVERLERARRRLAAGQTPTAEDLAGSMVGRLVCDRLR
jgi:hypothetical protein